MIRLYVLSLLYLIFFILSGCSKITEQARLDRFEEKLKVKQIELSKKLNKDIALREKNITSIKKDVAFLKSKINNPNKNKSSKIKDSFKRYSKTLKAQGEIELIHYEIDMLKKLTDKESKLNDINHNINKISSKEEQAVIKSLKRQKSKLTNQMDDLYIDISWFQTVNRINLINAKKSASLVNESNIHAREGNFIEAINIVEKASKLTPNIPIIYAQLGSLYYLTGNNKSSLYYYKKTKEYNYQISGIDEMITLLENKNTLP